METKIWNDLKVKERMTYHLLPFQESQNRFVKFPGQVSNKNLYLI